MQPFTKPKPTASTDRHIIGGESVEVVAWCDDAGRPLAVNGSDIAPVIGAPGEERLFLITRGTSERTGSAPVATVVGCRRETQDDGTPRMLDDGAPALIWRDYYVRPDGALFAFNVPTLGDEQTLSRMVRVNGGSKLRDLYLVKGFRFATQDEFKAALAKANEGRAKEERRRASMTPEGRATEMARMQADAMREALSTFGGAVMQQGRSEQRKGGGANG